MKKLFSWVSLALILTIVSFLTARVGLAAESQKKAAQKQLVQKRATFYPTYGYLKGDKWIIPMRIWVSEELSFTRRLTLKALREVIQHATDAQDLNQAEEALFEHRAADFLRDSESRESAPIQFDKDQTKTNYYVRQNEQQIITDRNGLTVGNIVLSKGRTEFLLKAQNSKNGWLTFATYSREISGQGRVRLIPQKGLSIISDIDDTIKITEIPKGTKTVLRNTFFNPYRSVESMLTLYRSFPSDTSFHYVSGSPWQLYPALADFLFETEGFPRGSIHMKNVRINLTESDSYKDIAKLVEGGATIKQKTSQIKTLLIHFPKRMFILIGDSGEHDPEVFREIAKQYPKQIKEIRIRDVVDDLHKHPERLKGMIVLSAEQ